MNEYSELIEKICLKTIPGWEPSIRIQAQGEYVANPDTQSRKLPPATLNIKVRITKRK